MDSITLTGISATGFHGVHPEERRDGQLFVADVELGLDLETTSDDLADTVSYSEIAEVVEGVLTGVPHNLIETVAGLIAAKCLEYDERVQTVRVTVHKPQAPVRQTFADLSVTITRSR
ncbi:dihydroneopterin aldolase [Tessaracoccus sp. OS52]|uniref:dihydroneopterin aldolase n=1 Tax=Tessaracoccus sp. OS52 TaxID=2886691 RepID=UPI001D123303|nr:dihydroneopterin aldolase [Tessaracoccus sp. OS52]MCC2594430.1 dihydroneopterin aldolase [Tessaracoccus sp. OS52]